MSETQNPMEVFVGALRNAAKVTESLTVGFVEALRPVANLMEQIYKAIDFKALFESEPMLNLRYLAIADELKWPIFCESDEAFRNYILEHSNDNLEEYIMSYYSVQVWRKRLEHWKAIDYVEKERFPILEEAVLAYENGMYYSTVALCMCEMMGIITDLFQYCKAVGLLSEEDVQQFAKEIGMEQIRNEKKQLLGVVGIQEYGAFMWHYTFEYLMEYTLSSKKDMEMSQHHPMRNKVCHGEQTNFGTREHALKAILCVDMIMALGVCIRYTKENRDEEKAIEIVLE